MSGESPSRRAAAARSALGSTTEYRQGVLFPYPSLELRVYATAQGVRVSAVVWPAGRMGERHPITVAEATWQPSEVTELSVVDWGRRALARWLEEQMLPGMMEQVQ